MLAKIIQFVKDYQADIILVIGVILISLLSFSMGYIMAKQQDKEPIKFDYEQSQSGNHWSGNLRIIFGEEIG